METRHKAKLWLIGQECETITGNRLPSKKQVLQAFFFHRKSNNIRASAAIVSDLVIDFWNRARIPSKQRYHVITHVEKIFDNYIKLKKNRGRKTETQKAKEEKFAKDLEELFDIAHEDAMEIMTIEEDKLFLNAQRGGRKGYMGKVDKGLAEKEILISERELKRKERELKRKNGLCNIRYDLSSSDNSADDFDTSPDFKPKLRKFKTNEGVQNKTEPRKKVINSEVCSVFDRLKIPNRSGSLLLSVVAHGLGVDIEKCTTSNESLRRARIENREIVAKNIKAVFSPNVVMTVHWDGKLLPDLSGRDKVDRLPILVTGRGVEKLLAAPKLESGAGENMSQATLQVLQDWNIPFDHIVAICFDTTASNTGVHVGACILLEKLMGKSLLYTACRHHIHEVVLSHVYKTCFGTSSGPNIPLFQRFRDKWCAINHESWLAVKIESTVCGEFVNASIHFAQKTLEGTSQPRDDYKEFLKLALIFLGEIPRGFSFCAPGALHHARWMAKVLYAIKIYMFRNQFHLTPFEQKNLLRFSLFSVLLYMEHWFKSPSSSSAPLNDLILIKKLHKYREIDHEIADSALKAISGHLWYLTEDLVSLAFFSDAVVPQRKRAMLSALKKSPKKKNLKRLEGKGLMNKIQEMELEDFVTERSKNFFTLLQIDASFMETHTPETWSGLSEYHTAKEIVSGLKVVNDTAERGVKLVSDYSLILTKDETQLQFILQLVEDHRRKIPDMRKKTVVKALMPKTFRE